MASLCQRLTKARWITESECTNSKVTVKWTAEGLEKAALLAGLVNELCPAGVASDLDLECVCLKFLVEQYGRPVGPPPPNPPGR